MSEKPMVDEEEGESEKQEAEFRSFVLSTIRSPPKSGIEGLIASELGLAVLSTDPIGKVRHCLEAFLLVPQRELILTAAGLTEAEIQMLYQSCLGLSQMHMVWGGAYHVPWPFPEARAPQMLKWLALIYDQLLPDDRRAEILARLRAGDEQVWANYLRAVYRYSQQCHASFAHTLRSHFIAHAMPIVMKLMAAILDHLVPREQEAPSKPRYLPG